MRQAFYGYVRALEFEGRHPHDVGQWGITSLRLNYLEGLPNLDQHLIEINQDRTYQNTPPHLHRAFWRSRIRFYRRIRSAGEAQHVFIRRRGVGISKACLPLSPGWVNPPDGVISMPSPGERFAPDTHAVMLFDALRLGGTEVDGVPDALHFLFQNTWGPKWGKNGYGLLPFAYYDRYVFEQWEDYRVPDLTRFQSRKPRKGWVAWQARDEFDRRMYAFEAGDPDHERLGWAFVIESDDAIEVEELFVAHEARRRGIGRELADFIVQLASAKSMPIRLWVPFADTIQESPGTAPALPALARRLGVTFHPSPVPWAAYYATSELPGSDTPIEPEQMPGRPKSTMGALAAFAASLVAVASPIVPQAVETAIHATVTQKITLESPEWAAKNARRAALIRKKNRGGLDPTEQHEFEALQQMAVALVEATGPRPELLADDLEAKLAEKAGR